MLLKVKRPEYKVGDIAKSALVAADNNVRAAAKLMENEILSHEGKYRALMDPLVSDACYRAVSAQIHQQRDRSWTAPNYDAGGNGSRVHVLAESNLLMLFPLPGGKLICDATHDDVLEAAEFYRAQANNMVHKARWLQRIADQLKDGDIVSTVFREEDLRKLQAEVAIQ